MRPTRPTPLLAPQVQQLFPPGTRRLSRRPGRAPSLLVVPSRRSPRMLVPSDVGASAEMLRRHSRTRLQRMGQDVVSWSLRTGLLPLLPVTRLLPAADGVTVEEHVREHVPGASRVGVMLGPPRANGKPVLRVFDAAGRTIAFGKVAHDDLSSALVAHEAAVLRDLGERPFTHLVIPRVLHAGTWNGRSVLYLTPLSAAADRGPLWDLRLPALQELAESWRTGERPTVAESAYVADLRSRLHGLPAEPWLVDALDAVVDRFGEVVLQLGRWHGDWAPWNLGSTAGRQQVWDWERSATGVPMGLDAVHFLVQRTLATGAAPAADELLDEARPALARWCSTTEQVEATALLYVLEILHRYVGDAGDRPAPALLSRIGRLRRLLPVPAAPQERESRVDA